MKHSKLFSIVFSAIFFIICIIPGLGLLIKGDAEAVGNENLSPKPMLRYADGTVNTAFLNDFTNYFGDNFAFRHELITANTELLTNAFGVSGSDSVTQGKGNWLFYTETMDDYMGTNVLSEREISAAARSLQLMQEYCADRGARFIFTIAPNKASLYPQFVQERFPMHSGKNNAELLAEALKAKGVPYVDLFSAFRAEDEVLYFETDSHWNNRGAALAADEIFAALSMPEKAVYYKSAFNVGEPHSGDVYQMLYPAGSFTENDPEPAQGFSFNYDAMFRSVDDISIFTENAGKDGKILMFRDSFGIALHRYMAEEFGSAVFSRLMPYDLNAIDRECPDTVVVELVERNIDWLVTRALIFEAPQRNISLPKAGNSFAAEASCVDSESMMGYVEISGNINCPDMDANSRIYVSIGGTVYEASPAGEGENPFTMYVPAEIMNGEQIIIAVNVNGAMHSVAIDLN